MSSYVLEKGDIDILTQAVDMMVRLSMKYPGSYPLNDDTIAVLGKYAGDMHSIYRALYIANIKAVNGRYREDTKTLPKYTRLYSWDTERPGGKRLEKAVQVFDDYMYQIAEDPIYGTPVYKAFYDVYKLLSVQYVRDKMYEN